MMLSEKFKDVLGYKDYQGTGYVVEGTATFIESRTEFDYMKEIFSFLTRVLEITVPHQNRCYNKRL